MKTTTWIKGLSIALIFFAQTAWAADGTLYWAREVTLSSPVTGVVDKVEVGAGDSVPKGQILVQYEQEVLQSRVNNLVAQLETARKMRNEAEAEYVRAQEMYKQSMLSEHDLQLAKLSALQAQSDYLRVKTELELAQYQLNHSRITAPYNAIVLQVHVVPGSTVVQTQQANPLVTIASDQHMMARVTISVEDAISLKPGDKAKVKVNGQWYSGQITQVVIGSGSNSSIGDSAYVDVEFAIPVKKNKVYAGMKVSVELP